MKRSGLSIHLAICGALLARLAAADTSVGGAITANTTWTLAGSPYVVTSTVTVNSGVTLTVEPGVTVKFNSGGRLEVSGTLTAVGTSTSPILFTSSAANPTRGSWQALYFRSGSSASRVSYATVSWGGASLNANVSIDGSSPQFDHLTSTNALYHGIFVTGAGATPVISDSVLSNNGYYGLQVYNGGGAEVTNTSFTNNTNWAVVASAGTRLLGMTGLTATGNGGGSKNGIGYEGGTIGGSETWRPGLDWVMVTSPAVGAAGSLTVEPGTTVKFNGGGRLEVSGTLTAVGTSTSPILFTSSAANPTRGSWQALYFRSGSSASRVSYATVSWGGASLNANVSINGSSPQFDHLTSTNALYHGIFVTGAGATPVISDSVLSNNGYYGLQVYNGGGAEVTNTSFTNNTNWAVVASAGTRLLGMTGLTATGNGGGSKNGIGYEGGTIGGSETWRPGLDWVMVTSPTVGAAGSLTVEPGTTVKFNGGGRLEVSGTLTAVGTSTSPILFTSSAANPTPGSWTYLYFNAGSSASRLSHATISYGGSSLGAIRVEQSAPQLDRLVVSHSAGAGLFARNAGAPSITNSHFHSNASWAVQNDSPATPVHAEINYWNAADGPGGVGGGTGQGVTAGVVYEPWLIAPPADPHLFGSFAHQNRTFNPTISTVSNFIFATTQPADWQVAITTAAGGGVRTLAGSGGSATAVWEGRDENGVLQADGTYSYAVESTAATGERVVAHGRVVIDSNRPLTLSGVAAAPTFFSPNGDGVQESTTLTATASYDTASWAISVRDSGGSVVRTSFGSGAAISYAWDGRNGAGSVQPDGVYALEVGATVGTATTSAAASATLDATYPTLAITAPASGGMLSNVRQGGSTDASIAGTAADAHLTSWTLEWGSGSNPATWTALRTSTASIASGELAVWPTVLRTNGAYTLRLRAADQAGNANTLAQPLTIGNFSASQVGLEFNAAAGATVAYTSVVPLAVTEALRIKNEAGQVVRTLVNGPRAAGTYSDVWNGRSDAGALLPDGAYFYVVEVSEGSNTMVWDLTTQYRNDYLKADDDLNLGAFDPFNNQPLTFTYSFPAPGRISIGLAPTAAVDGTCDPPQFCLFHQQYQESGPHTVSWAGVDPDGVFRSEVRGIGVINNRELFSKNAVVLHGTKPGVTAVRVAPAVFGPAVGTQTVSFQLATYQNQPAAVTVSFLNQESRSVLRTLALASQAPGAVSVVWDGRADNDMLVAPGAYTVTVTATDPIGNRATGQILTTIQY